MHANIQRIALASGSKGRSWAEQETTQAMEALHADRQVHFARSASAS